MKVDNIFFYIATFLPFFLIWIVYLGIRPGPEFRELFTGLLSLLLFSLICLFHQRNINKLKREKFFLLYLLFFLTSIIIYPFVVKLIYGIISFAWGMDVTYF